MENHLYRKYNIPVPRYTSYPTVPFWQDEFDKKVSWPDLVHKEFEAMNHDEGMSLYLHLPFCESLCTYCGCNKRITKNHNVECEYIDYLLKEWDLYIEAFGGKPVVKELHLGGGTPTFFSPENLKNMLTSLLERATLHENLAFGFEAHPNNTNRQHLDTLFELGFRRLSLGVQDFDPTVQKAINRIQPYEIVEKAVVNAREAGYEWINFDLIYGLPFQTEQSILQTMEYMKTLKPERIAFYSYAHVPWKAKGQRGYSDDDLPSDTYKRGLYELGREKLLELGYKEVGMDHFALPEDELFKAYEKGELNRNFMGYTTTQTEMNIGLGVSSISDITIAYGQNEKLIPDYYARLDKDEFPITKGITVDVKNNIIRKTIKQILCNGKSVISAEMKALMTKAQWQTLKNVEADGLIRLQDDFIAVTDLGKPYIRTISAVFDPTVDINISKQGLFSTSI
jgi:oxygen-independent coproporphyrinogen-3 oxidase